MNTLNEPHDLMLAHLRAATKKAHTDLEAKGFLTSHLSLATYQHILGRFYGFWRSWQPQIADLLRDDAFTVPRQRLHLLAADLAALGVSSQAMCLLPVCPLTSLHNKSEALGALYVLEGSTLGGRVIQQNVKLWLGDQGHASCSYFNGYGRETGAMWHSFLARLNKLPMIESPKVACGALATFDRIGSWLAHIP